MEKTKKSKKRPGAPVPEQVTLSEKVVKQALEQLNWASLEKHIDEAGLNKASLGFLSGQLRRTSSLIMPYPNPDREGRRSKFFESLKEGIRARRGRTAVRSIERVISSLEQIERGYRGILIDLEKCDISTLPAIVRASACISRAAHQYLELGAELQKFFKGRTDITLSSGPFLMTEQAPPISPDAVIAALIETATMTLQMEAIKNGWFDHGGRIVLPPLPAVGNDERHKAGSIEYLALCWRQWQNLEERHRFLGGSLERYVAPNLPQWAPKEATELTTGGPSSMEVVDWVANERLNDRVAQTFMEMSMRTTMEGQAKGITKPVPLLPSAFTTAQEAHAGVSLSEVLSYDIGTDKEKPGGLRFVEWIRGYSVLSRLTEERQDDIDPARLIFTISREELLTVLERCGLDRKAGETFIDATTLQKSSRDLFDCPLIAMADGSLLVFGPGALSTNAARITLSNIAQRGESLERKGKAFEKDIRAFLNNNSLDAKSFEVKRNGEQYEYDVVFVWGDYVFVLECKNHSLSHHRPVPAYYFWLDIRSSARQVKRLVENLKRNPDILRDQFGVEVANKKIIPCVLNALTFSLPGALDGVYFTDASSLKRFFQERYFHVNTPYRIMDHMQILHRAAVHSLWSGESPTVEDLLRHLDSPFQLKLMLAHVEIRSQLFSVGGNHLVVSRGFARKELTLDSYAEVAGVSAKLLRKEQVKMRAQVKGLKKRLQAKRRAKKIPKKAK